MSRSSALAYLVRFRNVAFVVVVALIAGLLSAVVGVEGVVVPAEAATGAAAVSALPSMGAAMRAAQNQGSRVEVLSLHTSQERVWANPDGSVTVDSYSGPEWVQRADGSWDGIDTTLSVAAGGAIRPEAAAASISLANGAVDPAGSAAAAVATIAVPGDKVSLAEGAASVVSVVDSVDAPVDDSGTGKTVSVTVGWNGDLAKPTLSGNVATYADAAPGQDLRIEAKPRGIETFVDLKVKPDVVPDAGVTVRCRCRPRV